MPRQAGFQYMYFDEAVDYSRIEKYIIDAYQCTDYLQDMRYSCEKEDDNKMKFVAKQEGDLWYLGIFKGRTIRGTSMPDGVWKPFVFQTGKQARDCAKELNDRFLPAYEAKGTMYSGDETDQQMLECIQSHLPTTPIKRRKRKT